MFKFGPNILLKQTTKPFIYTRMTQSIRMKKIKSQNKNRNT